MYLKYFPVNNIKVIIYENYKSNNKLVLKEISDFLGIKEFNLEFVRSSNVYRRMRFSKVRRIVWAKPQYIKIAKNKLGKEPFNFLTKIYIALTTRKIQKPVLEEGTVKLLKKKYTKNVVEFEAFLKDHGFISHDFDLLGFWGYKKSN
jgi:hypothetical protein